MQLPGTRQVDVTGEAIRDVVITIHGIQTRGRWQKQFDSLCSEHTNFITEAYDYGYLLALKLLFERFRKKQIDAFADRLFQIKRVHPYSRYHVVAHSFGSYITMYALLQYDFIHFDKIILCGSILPQTFPLHDCASQFNLLRHEVGGNDAIIDFWTSFIKKAGKSGTKGFDKGILQQPGLKGKVIEQRFNYHHHSDFFKIGHMQEHWIDFLREAPVPFEIKDLSPTIIQHRTLVDQIHKAIADGPAPQWINLHAPTGYGKSHILYQLRRSIRNSASLIDCLFPPARGEFDEEELLRIIYRRIGGHAARPTPFSSVEWDDVSQLIDQYRSKGRNVVFMIDHDDKFSGQYLDWLLKYINQFTPAAIVVASNFSVKDIMPPLPFPFTSCPVPVYDAKEALDYLRKEISFLPPHATKLIAKNLENDEKLRHPITVKFLATLISADPSDSGIEKAINTAKTQTDLMALNAIVSVMRRHSDDHDLAFKIAAPAYLNMEIISSIESKHFSPESAGKLLEELFLQGYLDRHYPNYWLKDFYREMLKRQQLPTSETYEKLAELEINRKEFSYEQLKNALEYIDKAGYTEPKRQKKILQVFTPLSSKLSPATSFPSDPALDRYFNVIEDIGPSQVKLLYARYLECQGEYPKGIEVFDSLGETRGFEQDKLRLLDKLGQFQAMLEIIGKVISPDIATSATTNPPWNSILVYYYGRCLQGAGSLAQALDAYRLVERFEDADRAVRIHAFIEQATIWVFAEEPRLAFEFLERATELADSPHFYRDQIDIFRYRARAHKLNAYFLSEPYRNRELAAASAYAEKSREMSDRYFYKEGKIWALVLRGRLAYFNGHMEEAIQWFREADSLIEEAKYYGAKPHVHRHWALACAVDGNFNEAGNHIERARYFTLQSGRVYLRGLVEDTWAKILTIRGAFEAAKKSLEKAKEEYQACGLYDPPFTRIRSRVTSALENPSNLIDRNPVW